MVRLFIRSEKVRTSNTTTFTTALSQDMLKMMSRSISPSPEIEPHHEQPTKTTSNLTSSSSGKRKRDGVESHDLSTRTVAKKKRSEKSKAGEDENLDLVQGLNMTIGKLDSRLLADYVAQRQRRFGQYLSSVEMEDRYIPGTELQI